MCIHIPNMEIEFESEFNKKYSPLTNRILGLLSENSRISVTDAANILGISRKETARRLKAVEREFGLFYTLELDESALGLDSPHLIGLKFGKGLDKEMVAEELGRSHIPQLVIATKGNYDLMIYANGFSRAEYASWDRNMRRKLTKNGELEWHTSEVTFKRLGFFPLSRQDDRAC